MGFFKNLLVGAAVIAGINYITKKRPDGTSVVDDLKEKAPEWMEKAKQFGQEKRDQFAGNKTPIDDL
ncbi:MAG: YtxH domain-containing protein [Pyrinomonadaceae bacterium]|nr:YtxH domain-containing protein [Sphingobacteriaceae bacterium]